MISLNLEYLRYKGEENLFSSLSLNIREKERVLILSEPGSGKTSLARSLSGSGVKYYSIELSGTFSFDNLDLFSLDIANRKDYVARSSQNTDEAILFPTVIDEIAFALEQKGMDKDAMDKRLDYLLSLYDLEKYRNAETSELSGGEKRRLNLATLDAIDPKFFIYDEAFDELSPSWRRKLLDIIKEKDYSLTLGSHYLKEYENFFDSIYEIRDKKLVPYKEKAVYFTFPEFNKGKEKHTLTLSGITFKQSHKSSIAEKPFTLSVGNLSLESGSIALLTGENGAGKSTLSKLIVGLNEEEGGSVTFDDVKLKAKARKKKVSYLFQNPFNQLYLPTVYDELKTATRDDAEIKMVARDFSLDLNGYTEELSYGKAKALQAAIFYLISRPFAIFDEIDSALSYSDSMKILNLYLEKNIGLLLISHDERIISSFKGKHYIADGGLIYES